VGGESARSGDVRAKAQIRLVAGGVVLVLVRPQVAGVEGDGEVGAAAQTVSGIHRGIRPLREMRTDRGYQVPAEKPIRWLR
jgi:hypothetical protein